MLNRVFQLFKIARKLSVSGAVDTVNQIYTVPLSLNIFFSIISLGSKKKIFNDKKNPGEKLCIALQGMGTTFIKLGQFLATRPDIIGEDLSSHLEKLQDKVPPFSSYDAKEIIKKNLGNTLYQSIINLSEPVAAASIAQVHKAQINDNEILKDVAIKVLRPNIKKKF